MPQDNTSKGLSELTPEQCQELFTNAPIGVFTTTSDGHLLSTNPFLAQMHGYDTPEELIDSITDIPSQLYADPEDRSKLQQQLATRGQVQNFECRFLRRDGSVFWASINIRAVRDATGSFTHYQGFVSDITAHKQTEEALRKSEEKYRTVFENTGTASCILEKDGTISLVNARFAQLAGYHPEQIENKKTWMEFVVPEDLESMRHQHNLRRKDRKKALTEYEFRFVDKDSNVKNIYLYIDMIPGTDKSVASLLDITDLKRSEQEMKAQKRLLEGIINGVSDVLAIQYPDLSIERYNQTGYDLLGMSLDEVKGRKCFELIGRLQECEECATRKALKSRKAEQIEKFVPELGIYLECRSNPILDEKGNVVQLIEQLRDITEYKQKAEALRESEQKLRSLFSAMTEAVVLHELVFDSRGEAIDYRIIDCNQAFTKMTGISKAEAVGKLATEVYGTDTPPYWQEFSQVAITGTPLDFSTYYQPLNKHLRISVVSPEKNKFATIITDITELKKAEETIRLNEKRLQTLLDLNNMKDASVTELTHFAMEAAVSLTGSSMGYVAFPSEDETVLNMFAWSSKAMQECAIKDKHVEFKVCDTGLWGEAIRQRRAIITNDYSTSSPLKKGMPEGHVHVTRHMNVPIFDQDRIVIVAGAANKPTAYSDDDVRQLELLMSGLWTILCRKRAEQEREQLQARLLQAQKMESIGIMAGGVAHDFNNLLQTMSGNIEFLLQDKSADHPDISRLQAISRSIARSASLVQQLLLAGRKAKFQKVQVDLNEELQEVFQMLERVVPKMIALELHLDPYIEPIAADPVQIEQVLLNLANNAVDAMPQGGRLAFETNSVVLDEAFVKLHPGVTPGNYVLLSVTDTGCGMDRETLHHIFDPFFTTKETGKGNGLGLATAYGIINAHGGYIQCYSEPGQGTTFKIFFPVQEADALQPDESAPAENAPGGRETILVVDDEPEIRELTREALESLGYSARVASSGEEALDIYKQQGENVDLVLLDLNMPGMGGRKCLQELLHLDPRVRVLIASGYASNGLDVLNIGSRGYLGKPYQINELAAKIREVLDDA
ncbi:multi-sensor hybrid histidine kinase [Desulfonatronospira thiodismutans ASO3-1]|uniref:histidine kinase n=1 Tax=Desulfonatronospira thiodismutans ASO3-1 TaxID=555779 RepID=D6SKD6_9BACT|nr:PAS domain S-box protein [Desulfonatronospira thiodismutans]EFI36339.1 multi-sensor hybrid histidine kinase [Desulfonatronospira thiodismutans ASO3-1]